MKFCIVFLGFCLITTCTALFTSSRKNEGEAKGTGVRAKAKAITGKLNNLKEQLPFRGTKKVGNTSPPAPRSNPTHPTSHANTPVSAPRPVKEATKVASSDIPGHKPKPEQPLAHNTHAQIPIKLATGSAKMAEKSEPDTKKGEHITVANSKPNLDEPKNEKQEEKPAPIITHEYSKSGDTHGWLVKLGTMNTNGQCEVGEDCIAVAVHVDNSHRETLLTTAECVKKLRKEYKAVCVRFAWGATVPVVDMTPHEKYGREQYHRGPASNADNIAVVRIEASKEIKNHLKPLSLPHENKPLVTNGLVTKLRDDIIQETSVSVLDQQTFTNNLISYNERYSYQATVWLCIRGKFTYKANSGSPYYVKTSNDVGVLYGLRMEHMPAERTNQFDDGAVFIDIIKYLQWIITTARGPIGRGYSGKPPPAKYIKKGNMVHDPDTGKSWRVEFHQPSHYGDLSYECNQGVTHLMKIGQSFHDPNDPECYWTIYTTSSYDFS